MALINYNDLTREGFKTGALTNDHWNWTSKGKTAQTLRTTMARAAGLHRPL